MFWSKCLADAKREKMNTKILALCNAAHKIANGDHQIFFSFTRTLNHFSFTSWIITTTTTAPSTQVHSTLRLIFLRVIKYKRIIYDDKNQYRYLIYIIFVWCIFTFSIVLSSLPPHSFTDARRKHCRSIWCLPIVFLSMPPLPFVANIERQNEDARCIVCAECEHRSNEIWYGLNILSKY